MSEVCECRCGESNPPPEAETGVCHWRADCPYLRPEEREANARILCAALTMTPPCDCGRPPVKHLFDPLICHQGDTE